MQIALNNPYEAVLIERRTRTIQTITVRSITDIPGERKIVANIVELRDPVVLWSGDEYVAITADENIGGTLKNDI